MSISAIQNMMGPFSQQYCRSNRICPNFLSSVLSSVLSRVSHAVSHALVWLLILLGFSIASNFGSAVPATAKTLLKCSYTHEPSVNEPSVNEPSVSENSANDSSIKVTDKKSKIVILAGKPSHPPRMHEFRAGSRLLEACLQSDPNLEVVVVERGWPKDEKVFDNADAIIFYMDGGGGHEVVQENGRRKEMIGKLAKKGMGLGFMHFGVEVVADQAGAEFKDWIGGHYEHMFSCNPIWEPVFNEFPEHPITRGVKPFKIKDEWYMNMRFVADIAGNESAEVEGLKFQPLLVASPSDEVRNGPYVYPQGPYEHIQANKGRAEAMMWCVERPDGGRGFGFTGGHFHDNWKDDNFRKVVLNALLWTAKVEVPKDGYDSQVTDEQMDQNLDPK